MGCGYVGRILHVDLDNRKTEVEEKEGVTSRVLCHGKERGTGSLS